MNVPASLREREKKRGRTDTAGQTNVQAGQGMDGHWTGRQVRGWRKGGRVRQTGRRGCHLPLDRIPTGSPTGQS